MRPRRSPWPRPGSCDGCSRSRVLDLLNIKWVLILVGLSTASTCSSGVAKRREGARHAAVAGMAAGGSEATGSAGRDPREGRAHDRLLRTASGSVAVLGPHTGARLVQEPVDRGDGVPALLASSGTVAPASYFARKDCRELLPLGGTRCGADLQRLLGGAHGAAGLDQQASRTVLVSACGCGELGEGRAVLFVEGRRWAARRRRASPVAHPAGLPRGAHHGPGLAQPVEERAVRQAAGRR
jgi:hypothetical protein